MKNFLLTIALAFGFAFAAHAQTPGLANVMNGGTNNIAGNADAATSVVNSYTNQLLVIDCTQSEFAAIQVKAKGLSTTNTVLKFYFDQTLSYPVAGDLIGTNQFSFQLIVQGTNTYRNTSNYNIGNVGYLWLTKIENLSSNAVTNLTVDYFIKPKH